eukprot:scaffold24830_cov32-Tisochrysis_lutea.AAC.2
MTLYRNLHRSWLSTPSTSSLRRWSSSRRSRTTMGLRPRSSALMVSRLATRQPSTSATAPTCGRRTSNSTTRCGHASNWPCRASPCDFPPARQLPHVRVVARPPLQVCKVEPFQRGLKTLNTDCMINGRTRWQGFERAWIDQFENAPIGGGLAKCNPIAYWTFEVCLALGQAAIGPANGPSGQSEAAIVSKSHFTLRYFRGLAPITSFHSDDNEFFPLAARSLRTLSITLPSIMCRRTRSMPRATRRLAMPRTPSPSLRTAPSAGLTTSRGSSAQGVCPTPPPHRSSRATSTSLILVAHPLPGLQGRFVGLANKDGSTKTECGIHVAGAEKTFDRDLWDTSESVQTLASPEEVIALKESGKEAVVVVYAPWCQFCQVRAALLRGMQRLLALLQSTRPNS